MFNQIGQPRWNSPLVRMFGMKIGGAAAPTLAPEVAPSIDVNQMDDAAMYFVRGEKLCGAMVTTIAAAASNYSRFVIRNPADSGVLLITETIGVIGTVKCYAIMTATTVDDATAVLGFVRDRRWVNAGLTNTSAILSAGNASAVEPNAGNGKLWFSQSVPNGEYQPLNIVIPPGSALYVYCSSVNTAITNVGILWRERAVAAEELATG
jgi:hypothetical protein